MREWNSDSLCSSGVFVRDHILAVKAKKMTNKSLMWKDDILGETCLNQNIMKSEKRTIMNFRNIPIKTIFYLTHIKFFNVLTFMNEIKKESNYNSRGKFYGYSA